jgi:hypothetical protein
MTGRDGRRMIRDATETERRRLRQLLGRNCGLVEDSPRMRRGHGEQQKGRPIRPFALYPEPRLESSTQPPTHLKPPWLTTGKQALPQHCPRLLQRIDAR